MKTQPERLRTRDRAELVFSLKSPSDQPLGELLAHHGRKFHIVIVSKTMDVLGHIHPEDFDDEVDGETTKAFFTFPQPGDYLVAVDFMTEEGAQNKQFMVEVKGAANPTRTEAPSSILSVRLEEEDRYVEAASFSATPEAQDYAVSVQQPDEIKAGEAASFAYRVMKGGEPLTDLRPYLEAPLHLAVVKDDLTIFLHTHGTLPDASGVGHGDAHHGHASGKADMETFGPEIAATVTFPKPGTYYLFAQAAHGEQLLISRVPVHVADK
ncbi:hypothetical protein [Tianweitania sediminis]|uniref:Uncharacterized protein n=1 Tax=Tianweitania sediminis TaxID=1502156 RepID=A0A8J7R0V6_9HYPH|nr:hypothetical protein [Tianweitania sediminis]MBP0438031.1 hypothetical protein [Tianweitania sediminis]